MAILAESNDKWVEFDLLKDTKYMRTIPGAVADFQSWSQELLPHLHIHYIVTCGGLTEDGRWMIPKRMDQGKWIFIVNLR